MRPRPVRSEVAGVRLRPLGRAAWEWQLGPLDFHARREEAYPSLAEAVRASVRAVGVRP